MTEASAETHPGAMDALFEDELPGDYDSILPGESPAERDAAARDAEAAAWKAAFDAEVADDGKDDEWLNGSDVLPPAATQYDTENTWGSSAQDGNDDAWVPATQQSK